MGMFRKASQKDEPAPARLQKQGIKRLVGIFRFMAPYRHLFIAGLVCLFFSSTILLAFPYFTGKLIDAAMGKAPGFFLQGVNQIALALMAVLGVQSIFSFLRIYFFARVNERAVADIRKQLYRQYISLPMSFFDARRSGELFSRITGDVSLLQETFSTTLAELIRQVVVLAAGLGILFYTNWKLTLFMLLVIPVIAVAGMVFGKFIRKLSKRTQDTLAEANIVVEETLQSIHTVKGFANEQLEMGRYAKALDRAVSVSLRGANYRGAFISFIIFALFGGIVMVLWYGSTLVSQGAMSIGDLTSFVLYTMFIGGSIGGLGDIYSSLQKAVGASERVEEILHEATEYTHAEGSSPLRLQGNIHYEGLRFSYPTRKEMEVIKGVDLSVNAGEKVAFVGASGSGKSTMAQLLMRFYNPDQGRILVDGQDVQAYDLIAYRQNLGIVPQEVLLFGGSIRENIAYGKPGASEEEIVQAAKKANAYDFICQFPEGMDTLVGERGVKLSGGQRQRIAIARAILKDPAILILDEATSALDAESEKQVQQALDTLMQGRTTLIIAHRLSTIRKADKICVIEQGRIAEMGAHEELASLQNGIYSNFLELSNE